MAIESKLLNQIQWSWYHSLLWKMLYLVMLKKMTLLARRVLKIRCAASLGDTRYSYSQYIVTCISWYFMVAIPWDLGTKRCSFCVFKKKTNLPILPSLWWNHMKQWYSFQLQANALWVTHIEWFQALCWQWCCVCANFHWLTMYIQTLTLTLTLATTLYFESLIVS